MASNLFLLQRKSIDNDMELRRAERARLVRLQQESDDIYARMQVAQDQANLARFYGCVFQHALFIILALPCALRGALKLATDSLLAPEDVQSRSALVDRVAKGVALDLHKNGDNT